MIRKLRKGLGIVLRLVPVPFVLRRKWLRSVFGHRDLRFDPSENALSQYVFETLCHPLPDRLTISQSILHER